MKQKLPEEKSSYKNLDLDEIRKTKILSNSSAKCSLIRLLIVKFLNNKNFVNPFDFQMITLSIDLRTSRGSEKNYILNSLMLFVFPVLIFIYSSNITNIVERNNFSLKKIQKQDQYRKNSIDTYKKPFRNFNKNFDLFLRNMFKKKKLSKHKSISKIIKCLNDPKFFKEIDYSLKGNELSYDLNFYKKFLDFQFFAKQMKDPDYFSVRKEILKNLRNWGESNEILLKSSFLLRDKENLYFSNYMKVQIWRCLRNNYHDWKRFEPIIFIEETPKYCYSEFNNSKLCITLENILSDTIYKFSRYLVYEAREFDIGTKNTNFLTGKSNKDINLLNSFIINKKENLQLRNSHTDNYNFQWITRMLYLNNKSTFIKRTLLNKSLFSLKKSLDWHFDFPINLLMGKYIIKKLFSQQKKQKVNPHFFLFPEPLLMEDIIQNTLSEEKINEISKNVDKQLKNHINSDDVGIISWKIRKYHSIFLFNYSFPFNRTYKIICHNYYWNKKIWYKVKKKSNQLFIKIFNLPSLFSKFKKTCLLINCIELKEDLIIKTNELLMVTKIENLIFNQKILLKSGEDNNPYNNNKNNNENQLIKNYCIYYSKLFNNLPFILLDSKRTYINNILHKYSRLWKINLKKIFIYNTENINYDKLGFEVSYWLYETKNSSKGIIPSNFSIKMKLNEILKKYFKNSNSKNINNIFYLLQNPTNLCTSNIEQNKIPNQILVKNFEFTENNINNLIANLFINVINNEIVIDLFTVFFIKKNLLLDRIGNKKIFFRSNSKLNFENYSRNFDSNYKENFLFYRKKNDIENNKLIYWKFSKNFVKYNRLNQIFKKQRSLFLEREIYELIQLKLNNETNSKIYFLEQARNKIETLFIEKEVKIGKMSANYLKDLNDIEIGNYYNILKYKSLTKDLKVNNLIFQSINQIFLSPILKYSKSKEFKHEFDNKILMNPYKVYYKSNQIKNFHFFEKNILFNDYNYTSWFFTSEWWKYSIRIFMEVLGRHFVIIGSYLEYFIDNHIRFIQQNLVDLCENKINLYTSNSKWNSRLFYYTKKITLKFLWSNFQLINNWNNFYWAILSLMVLVSLFYQNYFSIFLGSDSIDLWKNFETIKYLTDISRVFYFTELFHRNKIELNKTENFLIDFFNNLKHYVKNIRFYLLTKKNMNKWLINNKSLDLSRRKRNLLVQSLIIPIRIQEYGFEFYYQPKILNNKLFGYGTNPQQGLSYLRYLSEMLKRKLVDYSLHLADKWIFFASLQKVISAQTLQQTKKFDPKFQKKPVPLQLGLSCSKGILLIGAAETGRSYLIKNLAADSSVPLLGISINKLLYNKPDVITESWMNILIESLRRLNLTLDLAKGMSPCIIWIRNIHQLDVNRSTQNIESDPTFLLGILLKHFQIDSLKTRTRNNIIIIGSTHVPKKVDPSLISPDRLDRVLNLRLLNIYQRKNKFPILLNQKNLQLNKNLLYLNEFGSRTMGYNIRDLVAFTNGISLIGVTKNKSFVYDNMIELAFHRQIVGFSQTNNKPNYQQNFKTLLYRIGRVIIQNIMIEGSATNPLNISNYLWKKNFYYLSKWYSEPSTNDSIIKESTILVHVLGCLAGIAARDSWFLLEKDSNISISFDKSVENDLDLAFSLLETLSNDFPWLETCDTPFLNHGRKKPEIFSTKNFLNIMHSGIFAITNGDITNNQNDPLLFKNKVINKKICEFNNIAWSPRFWRLSFSRSNLFNWIKRPNDFEFPHTSGFSEKNNWESPNNYNQLIGTKKEQLFYERILPRVRKRNVEELESQFENILVEEQFEILGFFGSSTQYQIEYQLENKPRLFIGKRILWDPVSSFSKTRPFVFSRREFFVDEEMLRRLYITYGVRRERERSLSSHRIKQFFICRGYNKDLINKLSIRWWNQLPMNQKQNFYMLKRIEKIGIRLKRPQIFTPVYLYQRWLIENIPGKFSRLDLLTHRNRWIQINTLLLNDYFIYSILLESYQYLFEFFLSNKILLNQMTKTLLRKKWLFQNEIEDIIHNIKNIEF